MMRTTVGIARPIWLAVAMSLSDQVPSKLGVLLGPPNTAVSAASEPTSRSTRPPQPEAVFVGSSVFFQNEVELVQHELAVSLVESYTRCV